VELLVALLIAGLATPLMWNAIQGSIRFSEATSWEVQLQRDLDRLTTLLDHEAAEACLFGTTADPPACAAAAPACAPAAGQLRMRIRLLDANSVPTGANAVITYTRVGNELLRTGPLIHANGQLDPANTASTDQLVMRGVTAFTATPQNDCGTVTLEVTVQSQAATAFAGSNPVTLGPRTIGLRAGSRAYLD
jgi:hypothetical protein